MARVALEARTVIRMAASVAPTVALAASDGPSPFCFPRRFPLCVAENARMPGRHITIAIS
ncbi:MAG: hypothetical protein IJ708_00390 [Clostridia bacterium]|nr:hypothetical protein [Clostridia bacterium]